jgi:hypothetical protein
MPIIKIIKNILHVKCKYCGTINKIDELNLNSAEKHSSENDKQLSFSFIKNK